MRGVKSSRECAVLAVDALRRTITTSESEQKSHDQASASKFNWRLHMRQIFLLLSILLLGLSWAIAQDSSSPSGSGQMSRSSAGSQMTVQGCLSGSSGNYTITDKNGTTYQLTGDTAKLSEHVGHEVKVTGATSSAAPASGGAPDTSAGAGSQQTLQVTSVKHISKTCQAGGGMSH
jgi:hypothetical protein